MAKASEIHRSDGSYVFNAFTACLLTRMDGPQLPEPGATGENQEYNRCQEDKLLPNLPWKKMNKGVDQTADQILAEHNQ